MAVSCFAVCRQTWFCTADEWTNDEAETLAPKAGSKQILVQLLAMNITRLPQHKIGMLIGEETCIQSMLSC